MNKSANFRRRVKLTIFGFVLLFLMLYILCMSVFSVRLRLMGSATGERLVALFKDLAKEEHVTNLVAQQVLSRHQGLLLDPNPTCQIEFLAFLETISSPSLSECNVEEIDFDYMSAICEVSILPGKNDEFKLLTFRLVQYGYFGPLRICGWQIVPISDGNAGSIL